MQIEDVKVTARANSSQRIIAAAIVFGVLYVASDVVVTLVVASLLAYFLDPFVNALERIHLPRAIGALLVLLTVTALFAGAGYVMVLRANQFIDDWPRYSVGVRRITTLFDRQLTTLEKGIDAVTPVTEKTRVAPRITEPAPVREWLLRGVGSLSSVLVIAAFVPFLVFFMLAAKPRLWAATIELFPEENRGSVRGALNQVSVMLRSFVVGNALVAMILMVLSYGFFALMHLKNPFLLGSVSGVLNLVPYLGAVMAWVPPYLIGLATWTTIGPYLIVAAVLTAFHIIGLNILMPAIVGRRVHLNALAVTASLLFWGWIWGAIGLILAIPIMATIKVVCDYSENWKPVGRWLGA